MKLKIKLLAVILVIYLRRKTITLDILHAIHNLLTTYHKIKGLKSISPPEYQNEIEKSDILTGYKRPTAEYFALNSILSAMRRSKYTLDEFRFMMKHSPFTGTTYDNYQTHTKRKTANGIKYLHSVSEEVINHLNAIIYIHGGGYCSGDAAGYLGVSSKFGKFTRTEVFSLDYSLAPEKTIVDQVNEAIDLYKYILVTKKKIVLVGDSAGGGLVQATLQKIKEENLPQPSAACMISPWFDISLAGESNRVNEDADLLLPKCLIEIFKNELIKKHGSIEAVNDALFYNRDLNGLCPMYITASQDEILFSDSSSFVKRARKANCNIVFESSPYGIHDYAIASSLIPESEESFLRICHFLKIHLGISQ